MKRSTAIRTRKAPASVLKPKYTLQGQRCQALIREDNPDLLLQAGYMDFIDRQWDLLAAVAWQSYLEDGRGVLIVNLASGNTGAENYDITFSYMVGNRAPSRRNAAPEKPRSRLLAMLWEYDPACEVALVFLDEGGKFTFYQISAFDDNPPAAFSRQEQRLCEFQLH